MGLGLTELVNVTTIKVISDLDGDLIRLISAARSTCDHAKKLKKVQPQLEQR
jgi:hypothetical protein